MTKKYVLTGGPGVGKTTLLKELNKKGYYIIEEVATQIIKEQIEKNGNLLPWTDREGFQKEVMKRQQNREEKIPKKQIAFLDRGLADGIAYYKLDNLKAPEKLEKMAREAKYTKILLLEPLTKYENTETRRENLETAKKIHELIKQTYEKLGYKIIKIPELPPEERAELVEIILKLK